MNMNSVLNQNTPFDLWYTFRIGFGVLLIKLNVIKINNDNKITPNSVPGNIL